MHEIWRFIENVRLEFAFAGDCGIRRLLEVWQAGGAKAAARTFPLFQGEGVL